MNNQLLYFAKVKENAIIPSKRIEDSGFDIYSCFDETEIILNPGDIKLVSTGIGTAFSSDYVMFIKERSSTGSIGLSTRMGVIDSGYRGEIIVALNNTTNKIIIIEKGVSDISKEEGLIRFPYSKAIAQAVLCLIPDLIVKELTYENLLLVSSQRGVSLFGASGK